MDKDLKIEKLKQFYRSEHSGWYIGGMEYRMLMNEIDKVLED
jgi:hypothetical protein